MPHDRGYTLTLHTGEKPGSVKVGREKLRRTSSLAELAAAGSGWFHDDTTGITHVRTDDLPTNRDVAVVLNGSSAVGGSHPADRDATLDASVDPISVAGEATEVGATFTNDTGAPVRLSSITAGAPDGWTVTPSGPVRGNVGPGATFDAAFTLTPPDDAEPGTVEVSLEASYVAHGDRYSTSDRGRTTVAHPDLASAFNNVGVTRSANPDPGDLDGGGSSFLSERLAEKGVTAGATIDAHDFEFIWPAADPGTEDNVAGGGATISVSGRGNALAFLGTGTSGAADGTATVHYADGTTSVQTLGFPNWCCLATDTYGAKIAISTKGKNTPSGPAYPTVDYRLYTKTLRLDPTKDVVAVTLPANAAVHVFAMTVGTEEIVPPPLEDGQYSLENVGSGDALDAPGSTNAGQLKVSPVGPAPSQKWVLTRQGDGSYQVKNAGSGLCADVAGSASQSGAQVVQYTCTGTPNQRWLIVNHDGVLTIKAKHSGLSLAARPDALVVQETDTGVDSQRWAASAN